MHGWNLELVDGSYIMPSIINCLSRTCRWQLYMMLYINCLVIIYVYVSEMVYVWNGVCFWNGVWCLERMNLIGAMPKLNNRSGFGLSTVSLKLICWDGSRSQPPRNLFVEAAIVLGASPYPIIRDGEAPASTNHIPAASTVKRSVAVALCVFLLEDVPVRCPAWLCHTI
jgi:hypothetical protein